MRPQHCLGEPGEANKSDADDTSPVVEAWMRVSISRAPQSQTADDKRSPSRIAALAKSLLEKYNRETNNPRYVMTVSDESRDESRFMKYEFEDGFTLTYYN